MPRVRWVLPLLLACACGGKSGKNTPEGGAGAATAGATGASGAPAVVEPTCADTPRSADDEAQNAKLLDMAEHGAPDTLVSLLILLIQLEITGEATEAARTKQLEPYQAPIVAKLREWGVQNVERFWLINAIAAPVPLKYVDDLLCLPNVVNLTTDTPYWEIVDRPWGADEAGKYECPLQGEQCPEHCFDFNGIPFDEAAGCYRGRERVGCAVTTSAIDDGGASCFEQLATGKTYLFRGFLPVDPNFIGWRPCDPALPIPLCPQ